MSFSENLQYLRKKENLTQELLAERLEVSRQAVSKWESGQSYPEMDKLLQLCEMFRCDLDTMVKGDVTIGEKEDSAGYDKQMNHFSVITASAVSMIIAAVACFIFLEGIVHEDILVIGLFVVIGTAVSMLIVTGINHEYFKKRYAVIQNFYTEEEQYQFNRKFAVAVASGVCLIFFGLCLQIGLGHMGDSIAKEMATGLFLLCVAAAVWIFIYFGMQKEKYNIEEYNKENRGEKKKGQKIVGKISGVIMLLATAVFLYLGLICHMFHIAWIVYPIGGILCAIAGVIWGDE